jgi:glycosyltransferase involved in cell wall biosynthesis
MTAPAATPAAPRINLLLNNPFVTDSRSWKIARSLATAGWRVTVIARPGEGLPASQEQDGFTVIRVAQPVPRWLPAPRLPSEEESLAPPAARPVRLVRETVGRALQAVRFSVLARSWARAVGDAVPDADIWQSEGLITLPMALSLARRRGGKAVYDSRDVHVESARFARLPGPWRRLLAWRESRWARACDALITVSEPYAELLERTLGRSVDAIVRNCPPAWTPPDPPDRVLHEQLGLETDTSVVLYLGQVASDRGIEQLIDAIAMVKRAALVVAGFGPAYERCRALAATQPHAERIHFLPGVPPSEIAGLNAAADVAAIPVQPITENLRYNTPTKLFDAMGAGTPVVASDLPGMAPIVRETGCGVLCDATSPSDIARAIREVVDAPPERRRELRDACLHAARATYNWEAQAAALIELYARLGVRQEATRAA